MDRLTRHVLDRNAGYSALRFGRFSEEGGAYHLRTSVQDCRAPLQYVSAETVVECLLEWQVTVQFLLFAFIVMPEHLHVLGMLLGDTSLARIIGRLKAYTAGAVNRKEACEGTAFWQAGFFDRRIRTDQQLTETGIYIEGNPVRRDLVANPADYAFSSANPRYEARLLGRLWLQGEDV